MEKRPLSIKAIAFFAVLKLIISIIFTGNLILKGIGQIQFFETFEYILPAILFPILILYFIKTRNAIGLRVCIVLDFLGAIAGQAVGGWVVSIISFILSFTPASRSYLQTEKNFIST